MSALIEKAMKIACKAHENQLDKGGMPYICHPLFVASRQTAEEGIVAALLHDTVEDSDITLDDLRKEGFPEAVIEAVDLLTHKEGDDYFEYLASVKKNNIAREVKLADLKHNSDLSRLQTISEKDLARAEKYLKAIEFLKR